MAPGDLNLKKSWHPGLMKNQQKVWEKEQEALAERKKIQERQQEILKEKELAELRELQYAKTGKKVGDRVEWMYDTSGVGDGGALVTNEAEEYLLGKKRVDDLLLKKPDEEKKVVRGFDRVTQSAGGVISQREELSRSRDDPMAKINEQRAKKMQQVSLEKKLLRDDKERRHRSSQHRSRDEKSRSSEGGHKHRSSHSRSHRDDRVRRERSRSRDERRPGEEDRYRYREHSKRSSRDREHSQTQPASSTTDY
jgi:hypothetical protein